MQNDCSMRDLVAGEKGLLKLLANQGLSSVLSTTGTATGVVAGHGLA